MKTAGRLQAAALLWAASHARWVEAAGTDAEDEALAAHMEAEEALLRAIARHRVALRREAD